MTPFILPEQQYGTTLESLLERRERVAKSEGANYGANRMFPHLANRILLELTENDRILEVDAGAGIFTRLLLSHVSSVTAIEPVPLLYRKLEEIKSSKLELHCGFVEDLPLPNTARPTGTAAEGSPLYDSAVVSFPARRGRGILALICELLPLVKNKIFLVLSDDGSVDWSSVMRAIALKGYKTEAEFVVDISALEQAQKSEQLDLGQIKRAMLLTVCTTALIEKPLCASQIVNAWGAAIRVIEVPYPAPRGAATRLIRYFKAGGDRSILIKTDQEGMHHLYGNMRTAAHRIARDQIAVRRVDNGIQLMQVPHSEVSKPPNES